MFFKLFKDIRLEIRNIIWHQSDIKPKFEQVSTFFREQISIPDKFME